MKKFACLLGSVLLGCALIGCGGDGSDEAPSEEVKAEQAAKMKADMEQMTKGLPQNPGAAPAATPEPADTTDAPAE